MNSWGAEGELWQGDGSSPERQVSLHVAGSQGHRIILIWFPHLGSGSHCTKERVLT
jgi:hypothetical protein